MFLNLNLTPACRIYVVLPQTYCSVMICTFIYYDLFAACMLFSRLRRTQYIPHCYYLTFFLLYSDFCCLYLWTFVVLSKDLNAGINKLHLNCLSGEASMPALLSHYLVHCRTLHAVYFMAIPG